ncbi:MAG: hypothetical protein ACREO0_12635 [Pseudoxanthomonas sp.]
MDPQRRLITAVCLGGTAVAAMADAVARTRSLIAQSGAATAPSAVSAGEGSHDFDFLYGQWKIHNRRLKTWLAGSDEWIEFDGNLHCRPVLDGTGNVDEFTAVSQGIHGLSLRLYDPATRQWSDYWVSKRSGVLNPAMVGAFSGGIGTFHGDDRYEGQQVRGRAIWTRRGTDEALWEQAFSADDGKTWETNWTMRMIRQA